MAVELAKLRKEGRKRAPSSSKGVEKHANRKVVVIGASILDFTAKMRNADILVGAIVKPVDMGKCPDNDLAISGMKKRKGGLGESQQASRNREVDTVPVAMNVPWDLRRWLYWRRGPIIVTTVIDGFHRTLIIRPLLWPQSTQLL